MNNVLTPTLLEQPQTAGAYLAWVKSLIARTKAEDPDGLRQIRLRIGLAKELMQEAFPIGVFATRYFHGSDQVQIALKVGSQGYDAVVHDKRTPSSGIEYLEVTMALEGEADYLRMLTLHKTGQVSGLGRVTKTGTKKTGQVVKVEAEAVSQAEVLAKERTVIAEAIERKVTKVYPANTALVIGFDDTMSFDRTDNIANIQSTLAEFGDRLRVFHTVAVVGLVKNLFLCWHGADAA